VVERRLGLLANSEFLSLFRLPLNFVRANSKLVHIGIGGEVCGFLQDYLLVKKPLVN
jgi:hypothetical protein